MKYPKTRHYKNGNKTASLESHRLGYSINYSHNGRHYNESTYYVRDGWNRSVGRTEALRELKRNHFVEIKK